nr:MAG TPA: hypothetical protein [Caudoviricetes sp.]
MQGNAGHRHATAEHGNEQPSNGKAWRSRARA